MAIRQVEVARKAVIRGRNMRDLDAFVESGFELAEVELGGRIPRNAYISMHNTIKRHEQYSNVRALLRDGRIYLERKA